MIPATIPDAKAIATKLRATAAVIVTFGDGVYSIASYGHTRKSCDAARLVTDRIAELIDDGMIRIPDELRSPAPSPEPSP